ncbi:MAG: methyltransferase domain-containing protein [Chloroflexi bacterium]|nr:methyltransferase domain-containing protein [Chloroflexota bacterium]
MSISSRSEAWASGDAYEGNVGRWSRRIAPRFLDWLEVPPDRMWLDVGCGTGALSQTILQWAAPRGITSLDRSASFVGHVRSRVDDQRVRFVVGDAQALPGAASIYDAVVSGLVLNFVPEPQRAVNDMARVTRSDGSVAVYVWDYADKMQQMRYFWDAAAALDPAARALDEGRRFSICQPPALTNLFQNAGLRDVAVQAIDIATRFRDFDDYWLPFLGGQGPAAGYAVSLTAERRAVLRDRIRATLPFASDGSIPLMARAWAVRGAK